MGEMNGHADPAEPVAELKRAVSGQALRVLILLWEKFTNLDERVDSLSVDVVDAAAVEYQILDLALALNGVHLDLPRCGHTLNLVRL